MAYYKTNDSETITALIKWIDQRIAYRNAVKDLIAEIGAQSQYYVVEERVVGFKFQDKVPDGYKHGNYGGWYPRKDNKVMRERMKQLPPLADITPVLDRIEFIPGLVGDGPRYIFCPGLFFDKEEQTMYFEIVDGLKYTPPVFIIEILGSEYSAKHSEKNSQEA